MAILVITHGSCRDGFCAAWVCRRKHPDAEILHAHYGDPAPYVRDRDVVLVDFSYPRDVMTRLAEEAASLVVLDHHKTAQAALEGFEAEHRAAGDSVSVIFDMGRSGAGLAWDHFFPEQRRPWIVSYVEDRDLWRHALPGSRIINAYLGVLPLNFLDWDAFAGRTDGIGEAEVFGHTVLRKVAQYCDEASANLRWAQLIGTSHFVPVVNAPQVDISELLDHVIEQYALEEAPPPFVVGWWQLRDGRFKYSLRSRGEYDVSGVAERFGGGGHKNAAGFESPTLVHA